jgi:thioredoxin-related protein
MREAMALADQANKDIIVYYTRTNCPPCRRLQGQLKQQPIRDLYGNRFVFTAIWGSSMDRAERDRYRQTFGASAAPTLIVHRRTGEYVCSSVGFFDNEDAAVAMFKAISAKLEAKALPSVSAPAPCVQ